jgi:hypothetical protein
MIRKMEKEGGEIEKGGEGKIDWVKINKEKRGVSMVK